MMFNLPLPGGTTGHAVGMGIATIVLGPSVSILAISIALLIQALFFGDGGITAFGANCFNMAIVGSYTAFLVYRALSWKSAVGSKRRIVAAGLAGYGAINLAALLAAIEFGIQPMLFHDASGAPLYAPYPLSVSIPAMMLGHLTIAGLAEFVLSASLVGYLQRSSPEMLQLATEKTGRIPRGLLVTLGSLLLLTPLGILAVGSAWGEWSPEQVGSPRGMMRLYSLWSAPLPGYAPGFTTNASLAYLVSAVVGVILILLVSTMLRRLFSKRSFLEPSIRFFVLTLNRALSAEEAASARGLLQAMDPRVKIAGYLGLVTLTLVTHRLASLLVILLLGVALATFSHLPVKLLVRAWAAVLAFTGFLAVPAVFLTPGHSTYAIPALHWNVTEQGLRGAAFLILRAEAATTLSILLIQSTLWNQLLRALRSFRIPATAVVLLAMTYRYLFLLLETARSMLESRQTKLLGSISSSDGRRLAAGSIGVLLDKSMQLSSDVHGAMQARGFRGEVYVLDEMPMRATDWLQMGALVSSCMAAVSLGL